MPILKEDIEQLKVFKRRIIARVSRLILRVRLLERLLVLVTHKQPNLRVLQWLCFGVTNEALITKDRYRLVTLRTQAKLIVDITDLYRVVYFSGIDWETATTRVILELLRPGSIVCDVGANSGYFTLLMAGAVGASGHVHAFEPNPQLVRLLRRSVELNSFEARVNINQLALSDQSQQKLRFSLSEHPLNSGLSKLCSDHHNDETHAARNEIFVNATTLDDYFLQQKIKKCDLIKIDVEGAEAQVLNGMSRLLRDIRPRYIVCETELHEP